MSTTVLEASSTSGVDLRRWRRAMLLVFGSCGFALAAWVSRTPSVRDSLDASTAQMGWLIFAIGAGAIFGLAGAGTLVGRYGARPVLRLALLTITGGLALIALGVAAGSLPLTFAGLAIFGLGFGVCDVAMNVAGASHEQARGRAIMPFFHAAYSIGTLIGAGMGLLAAHFGVSVGVHLLIAAGMVAAVAMPAVQPIPTGVGGATKGESRLSWTQRLSVWRDPRTLLIGVIVLGMGLSEGAAEDWLPLATVDGYGISESQAAGLFGLFVICMTTARILGVRLIDRFGRVKVLRWSTAVAVLGLAVTIAANSATVGAIGIAFWGLGTALGLPIGMSAAADDRRTAAARVSATAMVGYTAFLIGPPALAFLGAQIGLLNAFSLVLVLLALAGLLAGWCRPATSAAS